MDMVNTNIWECYKKWDKSTLILRESADRYNVVSKVMA